MSDLKEIAILKQRVLEMGIKIKELTELIDVRNLTIRDLTKKVEVLSANNTIRKNEPATIKKILGYYARGYQFSLIFEKMRFNAYDITIDAIREICLNLDDLDNEYILHYKKEVKLYEESIKINPDLLKDNLIQRLQLLVNDASEDLVRVEDPNEKRKLREEINGHLKEMNIVLKSIIVEGKDESPTVNIVADMMKSYDEQRRVVLDKTRVVSI